MNPRLVAFSIVTCAAIAAWDLWAWRARRDAEMALAAVIFRKAALSTSRQATSAIPESTTLLEGSPTLEPNATRYDRTSAPGDPVEAALLNNPQLQNLKLAAQRAGLSARYQPLFQQLQLSPQQIGAFKDLVMKRDQELMDLTAIAQKPDAHDTAAEIATLRQQAYTAYDAGQRTLLGDDGPQTLKEYERTERQRGIVDRLAVFAATAGTPLTPEQTTRLTAALDTNWEALMAATETESEARIWATLQACDANLSPIQIQFLQDIQSIEQFKAVRRRTDLSGSVQR